MCHTDGLCVVQTVVSHDSHEVSAGCRFEVVMVTSPSVCVTGRVLHSCYGGMKASLSFIQRQQMTQPRTQLLYSTRGQYRLHTAAGSLAPASCTVAILDLIFRQKYLLV